MCGRFTLTPKKLKDSVGDLPVTIRSDLEASYRPSYNIAPSQDHPLVFSGGKLRLDLGRWGLIPSWSDDPSKSFINARIETALEKPTFRSPARKSRCLVPADGFYEWAKEEDGKQPYFFHLEDKEPFFFAGIFNEWRDPKQDTSLRTFAILTGEANSNMEKYHHRMPVVLPKNLRESWLAEEQNLEGLFEEAQGALKDIKLTERRVSKHVNSPKNNDESCVKAV